jgi:DNA polymerase sigma
VPIVKFVSPKYSLHCDIGINNHLACRNSELIRDYMTLDSRARDMCLLIKHWAKMRKINDPYRGTLSSYCYVMMVIHYLQSAMHCNPPVLPCLQAYGRDQATKEEIEAAKIDGFDCWYYTDIEKLKNFGQANQQSLGELIVSRAHQQAAAAPR